MIYKWEFFLEHEKSLTIESELDAEELAKHLMEFGGDGYICDNDNVVPVRRIVCVKLLRTRSA